MRACGQNTICPGTPAVITSVRTDHAASCNINCTRPAMTATTKQVAGQMPLATVAQAASPPVGQQHSLWFKWVDSSLAGCNVRTCGGK